MIGFAAVYIVEKIAGCTEIVMLLTFAYALMMLVNELPWLRLSFSIGLIGCLFGLGGYIMTGNPVFLSHGSLLIGLGGVFVLPAFFKGEVSAIFKNRNRMLRLPRKTS